jgi:hypothetical protein
MQEKADRQARSSYRIELRDIISGSGTMSPRSLVVLILFCLVISSPILAGPILTQAVIGTGGAAVSGPQHGLNCTVGQACVGLTARPTASLEIGFWPGYHAVLSPVPLPITARWWLDPAYPNPFNPRTRIRYALPVSCRVSLIIFDLRGQRVRRLLEAQQPVGAHEAIWDGLSDDGSAVASGLYIARLESQLGVLTRKMLLAR